MSHNKAPHKRPTIKIKARQILKRFPNREKGTGYIWAGRKPQPRSVFSSIRVYAIVVSNEGHAMVRDWEFGHSDSTGRSRQGWKRFLDQNFGKILNEFILPHYQESHGGFWRLHTLIGWSGDVNKRARNTKASKKRNQTTRQRGSNAKTNIRRRHGNK